MVNFRVIRIGDIVKNLVKVGILILCFILFTRFFSAVRRINLQEFIENRKKRFNIGALLSASRSSRNR